MKIIGQLLLWCGFLSGALAAVINPPADAVKQVKELDPEKVEGYVLPDLSGVEIPEDNWQLIPWLWYGVSAVVCVAGVVAIRVGKSQETVEEESQQASLSQIERALADAIKAVASVRKDLETLPPSQIVAGIDNRIADHLRIFAEGRDAMTRQYGLAVFADVMSKFAAGERAVNRAWSASADGYFDEADACLERGHRMLEAALEDLQSQASNESFD